MRWVVIIAVGWLFAGSVVAFLLGAAIRAADRRERSRAARTHLLAPRPPGDGDDSAGTGTSGGRPSGGSWPVPGPARRELPAHRGAWVPHPRQRRGLGTRGRDRPVTRRHG